MTTSLGLFWYKDHISLYKDPQYDVRWSKKILPYIYNGALSGKMASLYWNSPLVSGHISNFLQGTECWNTVIS